MHPIRAEEGNQCLVTLPTLCTQRKEPALDKGAKSDDVRRRISLLLTCAEVFIYPKRIVSPTKLGRDAIDVHSAPTLHLGAVARVGYDPLIAGAKTLSGSQVLEVLGAEPALTLEEL
jgi:hypothetical protein